MGSISESEWEAVNAFHDGELPVEERAAFETRLQQEPALAKALKQIEGASQSLRVLRPQNVELETPVTKPAKQHIVFAALAAAVALMAFALWTSQTRGPTLLELHQSLEAQSYTVAPEDIRNVAMFRELGVHDLSGANLVPVAAQAIGNGRLAHYAGVNGCRLSYFTVATAFKLPPALDAQAIAWTTADGVHHAIVATGMDLQKFDAIATYLQHLTHDLAKAQVYASMTQATQDAAPCVG
ncbi:MAG: hypothetical protein AAF641_02935 [Pseudomonadota bacterium]